MCVQRGGGRQPEGGPGRRRFVRPAEYLVFAWTLYGTISTFLHPRGAEAVVFARRLACRLGWTLGVVHVTLAAGKRAPCGSCRQLKLWWEAPLVWVLVLMQVLGCWCR
jgi:hypothetical protein